MTLGNFIRMDRQLRHTAQLSYYSKFLTRYVLYCGPVCVNGLFQGQCVLIKIEKTAHKAHR